MKSVPFANIPIQSPFFRSPEGEAFIKIPLVDVGEEFPDWPLHRIANRSLVNYRREYASTPDDYFTWLPDTTIVYIENDKDKNI